MFCWVGWVGALAFFFVFSYWWCYIWYWRWCFWMFVYLCFVVFWGEVVVFIFGCGLWWVIYIGWLNGILVVMGWKVFFFFGWLSMFVWFFWLFSFLYMESWCCSWRDGIFVCERIDVVVLGIWWIIWMNLCGCLM